MLMLSNCYNINVYDIYNGDKINSNITWWWYHFYMILCYYLITIAIAITMKIINYNNHLIGIDVV